MDAFMTTYTSLATFSTAIVGVAGLEPTTSWSQTTRATNCATPRETLHLMNYAGSFDPKRIQEAPRVSRDIS